MRGMRVVAAGWRPCPVPGGGRGVAAVSYGAGPASGTGKDDAVRAMTAAGLANGGVTTQNTCTDPAGTVLAQNPQPGPHVLTPGAPFTLTVTSGTDARGKPCVLK